MQEEGESLFQIAKRLKVRPKRLLSWEYDGHYEAAFRKKGERLVRFYPAGLADMLNRAVTLVDKGYGPRMAFYMAKRGETPPNTSTEAASRSEP